GASFLPDSAVVDGTLYFRADDGVHGEELWRSDGTAAGTTLVKDIDPGSDSSFPNNLIDFEGKLMFAAIDGTVAIVQNGNGELYVSDGTAAGTVLARDRSNIQNPRFQSNPRSLIDVNGTLIFRFQGGAIGPQTSIWKSDGTIAGTVPLPLLL